MKIVSELRDNLQNAVHAAIEAKSEEDRATTEAEKLAADTGSRFQDAADIITDMAPAYPLVGGNATIGGVGKFLEKYSGNVLWPTIEDAMLAYNAALEMHNTLKQIHEDTGKPCGDYKTFKLRFAECMPTYAGRSNFKAAAKERAIEMGLDQPGSIINPCFDPVEIAKAEVKEAKAAEAKAAREEYKDKALGGQIRADLNAVLNRVVAYLPTLKDAADIAEVTLSPEHEKQINAMKTRLANALSTMESQSIWADDFADYKSK